MNHLEAARAHLEAAYEASLDAAHDALQAAMWQALQAARAMGPNRTGIEASLQDAMGRALDLYDSHEGNSAPATHGTPRVRKCPPMPAAGLDHPFACHADLGGCAFDQDD